MCERLYFASRCWAETIEEARDKINDILAKEGLRVVGEPKIRSDVAPQWRKDSTWWEFYCEVRSDE